MGGVSARRVGVTLLALVLGAVAGAATAYGTRPGHTSIGSPSPVPAQSPSVPGEKPYEPDIAWPALESTTAWDHYRIDNTLAAWEYAVPKGWWAYRIPGDVRTPFPEVPDYDEVRFRPPHEPVLGGFSLRVKIIDNHETPTDEILDRIAGFERTYDDFDVLDQTDDAVYLSFRDESNHFRFNFFRWFAAPGVNEATLEMSVAGRAVDQDGLYDLFDQFAEQAHPVE